MFLSIRNVSSKSKRLLIDNQSHDIFGRNKVDFSFEERSLLLAEESDIVILHNVLPQKYIKVIMGSCKFTIVYFKSDNENKDLSEVILEEKNLRYIKKLIADNNAKNYVIQSYIPDNGVSLISKKLNIPIVGYDFFVDSFKKSHTQTICKRLGLRTINSIYLRTDSDLYNKKAITFLKKHKKVVLKPDIGMGGDSIFILETKKILKSKIHLSFPAVIQELISVEKEGSIQFIRFSNKWVIFYVRLIKVILNTVDLDFLLLLPMVVIFFQHLMYSLIIFVISMIIIYHPLVLIL